MDASLPAVPVFVLLLLGITHTTQACDQLDYCKEPRICPCFTRKSANQEYEVRDYEESVWMCTEVKSCTAYDVMAARGRLANFKDRQSKYLGYEITDDTWPGLLCASKNTKLHMCWLVPPNVPLQSLDDGVTVTTFSENTVYVRTFGGTPSVESGQNNMRTLRAALLRGREIFDDSLYCGAGYDSYFSPSHHNELWMFKNQTNPFSQ